MSSIFRFFGTSIAKKLLMAVTGLALIGFLAAHLAGNMLLLVDRGLYNEYSHTLISHPLIYLAEALLLAIFVGHFVTGLVLWVKGRRARPVSYQKRERQGSPSRKSLASSTMVYTGLVVLIFVPLHLITFKFGAYYASAESAEIRDLYRLVIEVFQRPAYVIWYVAAMGLIGFHLWHGFESAFESMGLNYRKGLRRTGQVLAVVLAGGFLIIPLVLYFWGGPQ